MRVWNWLPSACIFLGLFSPVAYPPTAGAQPPDTSIIHGQLADSGGAPITGTREYALRFFDAAVDGAQLGGEISAQVTLSAEGLFSIAFVPPAEVLDVPEVWYELAVDTSPVPDGVGAGDRFAERVRMYSVPFALVARQAAHVPVEGVGDGSVTVEEFMALLGVTGSIQAQLDAKPDGTSFYTQSQMDTQQAAQDTAIALKANAGDVYTKSQINTQETAQKDVIATKANAADVYTQVEIDLQQTAQDAAISAKLPRTGPAHVIVDVSDNALQNGVNLQAAYAQAAALTPHGLALATTNRAVVLVPPGRYDLGTGQLHMSTDFVDLVGLSPARDDQYLFGTSNGANTGVLRQTASNVRIENLFLHCTRASGSSAANASTPAAYFPDSDLPGTVVRNCRFLANNSNARGMRAAIVYSGTYEECVAESLAFGGNGTASGTFINCTGGELAFGGDSTGVASGTFLNCTGGDYAFGGGSGIGGGVASGTFKNCTGGGYAFGGGPPGTHTGTASGTFTDCTGGNYAFGSGGTASGTFRDCTGGNYAFGGWGTANGLFTRCTGATGAFGYFGIITGAKFYYCAGGTGAYTGEGVATFLYCIRSGAAY